MKNGSRFSFNVKIPLETLPNHKQHDFFSFFFFFLLDPNTSPKKSAEDERQPCHR